MSGAARIKYRSGEEYIRADIAEQMAEALRGVLPDDICNFADLPNIQRAIAALAAYEQAKGEEKE